MNKKVLIFDFLGVVAESYLSRWARENLGPDIDVTDIARKLDSGEMSEDESLVEFAKLRNSPEPVSRKEIDAYFNLNLELVDFIKELRGKGHKTILLSNANYGFFKRLVLTQDPWLTDLFEDMIISSEIKMLKPSREIYLYTLDKHKLKPEEVIFIDDRPKNIIGAEEVGISGIVFKDTSQLKEDLLKFDIN